MREPASCPEQSQLLHLLDAALTESEQTALTQHLDACPRCQQAVQELASGGKSWSEIAVHLGQEAPGSCREPGLDRVVAKLAGPTGPTDSGLPGDGLAAGEAGSSVRNGQGSPTLNHVTDVRLSLDFLAAPRKPGHLGQLDHYEIIEVVGHGGMGIVFRAFDDKLHRVVAIKALAPQLASSSTARQRFTREAQAAAAITHDNVIAIYAVEEAGPVPYLVMQYIVGLSLEERIRQGSPLELKEILRLGVQI